MSFGKLARWGGFAAIFGGVLEVCAAAFVPRFGPPSLTMEDPVLYQGAVLLVAVGSPLLAVGLAGLYARLAQRPEESRLVKALAITGLILAGVASLLPLIVVLQLMVAGQLFVPLAPFFFEVLLPLELWALPLATLLLGVATLGSGALGRWKALPLVLGGLMVLGAPYAVLGFGWILLGCVMLWSSDWGKAPTGVH